MKRFFKVFVLLMVLAFGVPVVAPATPPTATCRACLHACTGQGKSTPVCLLNCFTSGACTRP
jgi:hypothetical protein